MENKKTNDPAVLPSGAEAVKEAVTLKLSRYFGVTPQEATESQTYKAVVLTVKDMLISGRSAFHNEIKRQSCKRVYYMCMEFLLGRQLRNNLMNLGIADEYREALKQLGFDLDAMYEHEPDPGLGNGGLGRLAACYLDSLTTLDYPAYGYSLLYEYGFFRQKLVDGTQVELPDTWMPEGDVWLVPRTDKSCTVRFGGHIREEWKDDRCDITLEDAEEVLAVPYDLMISGDTSVGGHAVNILRLWKAQTPPNFNMKLFSQGQYVQAMQQQT
ncbi:MAG: glycogen/starch/alpha-glucan phosphorylase, partial [Clostridia bacterium]|nr:glycogen/starch/alpha-glucan phosphorylase [Clostridia bacterium]